MTISSKEMTEKTPLVGECPEKSALLLSGALQK